MSGHLRDHVTSRATGLTGCEDDLLKAREMADALVHDRFLGPALTTDLAVVLDEILSNVVRHGFRDGRQHEISIDLAIGPGLVVLTLEDDGPPFDPLTYPPPDVDADLDTRALGGLGIHLVRRLMDDVRYERVAERNRVVLRKRRSPSDRSG